VASDFLKIRLKEQAASTSEVMIEASTVTYQAVTFQGLHGVFFKYLQRLT
jgi:hypothetical protein